MPMIIQRSSINPQAENYRPITIPIDADGTAPGNSPGAPGARPGGSFILPVLLVLILAAAAISLSPAAAQLCAGLEDFPCGP